MKEDTVDAPATTAHRKGKPQTRTRPKYKYRAEK